MLLKTNTSKFLLHRKKPMIVTLWNGYADEEGSNLQNTIRTAPIIYGLKLKVTTFNGKKNLLHTTHLLYNLKISTKFRYLNIGVSLTMRNSSGIMINPPSTQDQELRNWYIQTKLYIS